MNTAWQHTSVLLDEAVEALLHQPQPAPAVAAAATYVDATFGRGGHARRILARLGPQDRLIAFDKDPEALAAAASISDVRFSIRHQVDMRMDTTRGQSVAQWLALAETDNIAQVIRDYGEERFAGPIARAIVARRQSRGPLTSTSELAQLVAEAVKTREPGQNPATRTFQALRIFINGELDELKQALAACLDVLAPGARLVVISFHSLEDRIVKQFIARHASDPFDRRAPYAPARAMRLKAICRSKPGAAELAANPRARSAIMRVAQRTSA
ncbi:MAG: 16S rRNA (cytosine(1402)-N(4))-methyltransferase RsmH [Burkholderiales bacterium]|nr:16S rRNA (cytosine(1402)-N(4))-methyltransferase RsmH [Burkholderiales bacterium]